jgi:hypothetical protein
MNFSVVALRFEISTSCEPGFDPAGLANIRPVGRIRGPGSLPAGSTFRTIATICGELVAPGADTSICP